MRKFLQLTICIIIACALITSCATKEDKANKLIRERMSKTLYDYNSYDPIETIVTEAKANAFNDTTCWELGAILAQYTKNIEKYLDDIDKTMNYIEFYVLSYRSSKSNYDKKMALEYKEESEKIEKSLNETIETCKIIAKEIKDNVSNMNENTTIGWEVNHRFRCKTKGGYSTIGNYRFIIDKDFKSIIIDEDFDNKYDKSIRSAIKSALNDEWDNWNTKQ